MEFKEKEVTIITFNNNNEAIAVKEEYNIALSLIKQAIKDDQPHVGLHRMYRKVKEGVPQWRIPDRAYYILDKDITYYNISNIFAFTKQIVYIEDKKS